MKKQPKKKSYKEKDLTEKQTKVTLAKVLVFVFVFYSVICFGIVVVNLLTMTAQNEKCRNVELGQDRYEQILATGTQTKHTYYTEEEIAKNSDLSVTALYHFPNDSKEKTKYVIILPGGGYFKCDANAVAFPYAAKVNEAGYTAFVLTYRYGIYSSRYAPLEDLAKAIEYITDNCEELNVIPTDYMITGYSAGGNLAGLFASEDLGYAKYNLPKPGSVSLIYPWININSKIRPSVNYWKDAFALTARVLGNYFLLGKGHTKLDRQDACVQNHVTSDYPPVFMVHGDRDFVVPHHNNSEVMEQALLHNNVKYKYTLYKGLSHGFGIGEGTSAENWAMESLEFWQSVIN